MEEMGPQFQDVCIQAGNKAADVSTPQEDQLLDDNSSAGATTPSGVMAESLSRMKFDSPSAKLLGSPDGEQRE